MTRLSNEIINKWSELNDNSKSTENCLKLQDKQSDNNDGKNLDGLYFEIIYYKFFKILEMQF